MYPHICGEIVSREMQCKLYRARESATMAIRLRWTDIVEIEWLTTQLLSHQREGACCVEAVRPVHSYG